MRRRANVLLYASRVLSICAVVASLAVGSIATLAAAFLCFDSCPEPQDLIPRFVLYVEPVTVPPASLAGSALAAFIGYCLITNQRRRAVITLIAFVLGAAAGLLAVVGIISQMQAHVPITPQGYTDGGQAVQMARLWGASLLLLTTTWTGALAILEWRGERR